MTTTTNKPTMSRLANGNGVTFFDNATEEGLVVGDNKPAKFTGDVTINDTEIQTIWNTLPNNSNNNDTSGKINIKLLLKDIIGKVSNMLSIDNVYPIGAVYISYDSTSPAELFGGEWLAITGVFPYFNAGTSTGGSNTHTLTVAQMPSHTHNVTGGAEISGSLAGLDSYTSYFKNTRTISNAAQATGGSGSHNNMPAYQTFYAWRRTA